MICLDALEMCYLEKLPQLSQGEKSVGECFCCVFGFFPSKSVKTREKWDRVGAKIKCLGVISLFLGTEIFARTEVNYFSTFVVVVVVT